jgi:glycosyltransferase involved in cell wall biosynthesis
MEALAARLGLQGRVVFTGMRSDVPSVLSAATVSVLPSLSEGLPNAILESMAAGLPVVATRVGGTPEAVQDGVTGLLVPPRDPAALVAALRAVIEDRELAARLGQAAKRRVTEWFSLERMVRRTEQLYDWLLARARRPRSPAAWSELPMEEHADDVRDRRLR